jgi:hypothetical protein
MKMDDVRRYIDLRDSLRREKSELEERLKQLNEALGETSGMIESSGGEGDSGASETTSVPSGRGAKSSAPSQAASASRATTGRGGRRGRRPSSGLSLRDAVLQVTASGPKTKDEILDGIEKLGYKFSTNNPKNSLGVILYGKKPRFKNDDGKFSPIGGSGAASGGGAGSRGAAKGSSSSTASGAGAFSRKKRQLSPEARERIAAAQRARWAKSKSGGK